MKELKSREVERLLLVIQLYLVDSWSKLTVFLLFPLAELRQGSPISTNWKIDAEVIFVLSNSTETFQDNLDVFLQLLSILFFRTVCLPLLGWSNLVFLIVFRTSLRKGKGGKLFS